MFTVITPETIQLSPGAVLRFPGTWQDYQKLCQQLGDRTLPRIKYRPGEILIMSPLPRHGREKVRSPTTPADTVGESEVAALINRIFRYPTVL
jgi:hypothetical protein